MAIVYHIIALLGGLAMFLYGMRIMGDGLKANSGGTMKAALEKVTNRPVLGFLLGCLVTCLIQSSTATIVLTVGLVGAGLLTFRQSIGVVLGANVGTAITAQIIRLMDINSAQDSLIYFFKADNLAPLALILGMVILMTTRRESQKNIGNVACGFGVLFMGLIFMSDAVSVFETSLSSLLTAFANNYLLGFGAGVLVTGVIQSSSAVIGIVQSVASSVGVQFNGVFAVIIGVNIGDCLTTFIVSRIGARPEQIRTAAVHVVYNIFAACLIIALLLIGRLTGLIPDSVWYMNLNSGGVANVHGLFRVVPAVLLLPFSGVFARITEKLVPDREEVLSWENNEIEKELMELDPHLITSPIMALDQVNKLVVDMAGVAGKNFRACREQVMNYSEEIVGRMHEREDLLDRITDALGQYLVSLTPYIKRNRDIRIQNFELKCSVCIERIGDACMDILFDEKKMQESRKQFSGAAMEELTLIFDAVEEIMSKTAQALETRDSRIAVQIEPLEEVIDDLAADLNTRHTYRMSQNRCDVFSGIQFQNILSRLEDISDQCSDISVYITELTQESVRGREHEYIHKLHHSTGSEFQRLYQQMRETYFTKLTQIPMIPEDADEKKHQEAAGGETGQKEELKPAEELKTVKEPEEIQREQ